MFSALPIYYNTLFYYVIRILKEKSMKLLKIRSTMIELLYAIVHSENYN